MKAPWNMNNEEQDGVIITIACPVVDLEASVCVCVWDRGYNNLIKPQISGCGQQGWTPWL